ncbi:MAG TPA: TQO small subunit DoxD [Candidatus Babeliales bacterium]|nr:TQO small subunit DoxD [Candidatus Babeliales bacterium]
MKLPTSLAYGRWLALVRILTGAIWLIHGLPKFLHGDTFLPPNGFFGQYLQQGISTTSGPYHDFMVAVVSPNAATFAELVRFGEVLVGISLLFGILTRVGGFFGIVLPLNYMAVRGAIGTLSGWGSPDASLALLSAISFVLPTGRVAGIDGFASRRSARPPKVVAEVVPERPLEGPSAPQ